MLTQSRKKINKKIRMWESNLGPFGNEAERVVYPRPRIAAAVYSALNCPVYQPYFKYQGLHVAAIATDRDVRRGDVVRGPTRNLSLGSPTPRPST